MYTYIPSTFTDLLKSVSGLSNQTFNFKTIRDHAKELTTFSLSSAFVKLIVTIEIMWAFFLEAFSAPIQEAILKSLSFE